MLRWILLGVAAVALSGCTSFSWNANKAVLGNSTGGIVPEAVTSETEAVEIARKHCAQYGTMPRVTATHAQAGGELIFVCEKPGQTPPPEQPVASYPGQPAYPGQRPPSKKN